MKSFLVPFLIPFFIAVVTIIPFAAEARVSARIITDLGTIMVELDDRDHPKTVENFVKLAKGEKRYTDVNGSKVTKAFYNGLIFHRVNPELGIFSGCPWGTGRGWPGFFMADENLEASNFDQPGRIAMAKLPGQTQYGSQFFITTKPLPEFNKKYTTFGKVVSGQEIVESIAKKARDRQDKPQKPIRIKTVEIVND